MQLAEIVSTLIPIRKREPDVTALAGLPLLMDLAVVSGMIDSVKTHLSARRDTSGWTDNEMVVALVLLNLPGRVMDGSRELIIRLAEDHPSLELLVNARETIYATAHGSPLAVGR